MLHDRSLTARIAVAYVDRLVTAAGMIWRQLTGEDIGLDGLIESRARGCTFVQVKGTASTFVSKKKIRFPFKRNTHDKYWLSRGVPVLICLVERAKREAEGQVCHWIDYSRAQRTRPLAKTSCTLDLTELKNQSPSTYLRTTTIRDSGQLAEWLNQVVVSLKSSNLDDGLRAAELLLEQGSPREALSILKKSKQGLGGALPIDLTLRLAKALRRLGDGRSLIALADRSGLEGSAKRTLHYELAFHYMFSAFRRKADSGDKNWTLAKSHLMKSFPGTRPSKEKLIAYSGLVLCQAMRKLCNRQFRMHKRPLLELRRLLGWWIGCGLERNRRDYTKRILNAQLALCRANAALGEFDEAKKNLQAVRALYRLRKSYHSPLWLAHLYLTERLLQLLFPRAWKPADGIQGDLALASVRDDPEVHAFRDFIEGAPAS